MPTMWKQVSVQSRSGSTGRLGKAKSRPPIPGKRVLEFSMPAHPADLAHCYIEYNCNHLAKEKSGLDAYSSHASLSP